MNCNEPKKAAGASVPPSDAARMVAAVGVGLAVANPVVAAPVLAGLSAVIAVGRGYFRSKDYHSIEQSQERAWERARSAEPKG